MPGCERHPGGDSGYLGLPHPGSFRSGTEQASASGDRKIVEEPGPGNLDAHCRGDSLCRYCIGHGLPRSDGAQTRSACADQVARAALPPDSYCPKGGCPCLILTTIWMISYKGALKWKFQLL